VKKEYDYEKQSDVRMNGLIRHYLVTCSEAIEDDEEQELQRRLQGSIYA